MRDKEVLRTRAQALAEVRQVDLAGQAFELLQFAVGGQPFAFEGDRAEHVFRFQETMLTPLPGCPPQIAGIVSRRGELLPIVRMHLLLGKESLHAEDQSVIVVSVKESEYGLLVDSLSGVRAKSRVLPADAAPWVQGVTRDGVTVLDLAALLTDERLGLEAGAVSESPRQLDETESIRVPVSKLETLASQAEELLALKLAAQQRSGDMRSLLSEFASWDREWARVLPEFARLKRGQESSAQTSDRIRAFLSFNTNFCQELRQHLTTVSRAADTDRRRSVALVDNTQELSKKLLMYPFSTILPAGLEVKGAEVEIDRRILDALEEPLLQLLQHGKSAEIQAQRNRVQVLVHARDANVELGAVRDAIKKLGGTLSVEDTTFTVLLPLTLATFRGILVRAAGRVLVFPTVNVERVLRVKPERDVSQVENVRSIFVDEQVVPLLNLGRQLGIPCDEPRSATLLTLVVEAGQRRMALVVDEILSEQEVLVRELKRPLALIPTLAGVGVLGNGELAPILRADALIGSSRKGAESGPRRILLVDDSIESRSLLKNILETAGYRVKTASNGKEALALLRSTQVDLLVVGLADGLKLTGQVQDVPSVLVSEDPEMRRRALEAGAKQAVTRDAGGLIQAIKSLF